jgi:hypothetical protein
MFAFFDKHGFGYKAKIQKMTKSYEEVKQYGQIKKSPKRGASMATIN